MKYRSIEYAYKILQVYGALCKPLCQEIKMPQTAFDILMFLANNPLYNTARDIVEIRKIKANLVSINVDKLVQEGFLERQSIENIDENSRIIFNKTIENIEVNLDNLMKGCK